MEEHPNLNNPKDFALMREMYFEGKPNIKEEDVDPIERLERMEAKERNINNNSR